MSRWMNGLCERPERCLIGFSVIHCLEKYHTPGTAEQALSIQSGYHRDHFFPLLQTKETRRPAHPIQHEQSYLLCRFPRLVIFYLVIAVLRAAHFSETPFPPTTNHHPLIASRQSAMSAQQPRTVTYGRNNVLQTISVTPLARQDGYWVMYFAPPPPPFIPDQSKQAS